MGREVDESDFVSAGGVTIRDITPPEEAAHLAPLNIISVRLLIMMVRWKGRDGTGRDGQILYKIVDFVVY